ncbi:MAG: S-layer homology domain-containing protein [Oscillospiraceae bacterium]|nr:S-layer homology domain-containing protein [Oscillospiraceae bacterium]
MKKIFRNSLSLLLGAALLVSVLPGIFAADDAAKAEIDAVRASVVEAATKSKASNDVGRINDAIAKTTAGIKLAKVNDIMTTAGFSLIKGITVKADPALLEMLENATKVEFEGKPLYTEAQITEMIAKYETIKDTTDIIGLNTPQQIMRAYAAAQPGDILLNVEGTKGTGYILKSVSPVYLVDGATLDPEESTATYITKKGEETLTFAKMYIKEGFVPYTLDILTLPEDEPVVPDHSATCLSKDMTDVDKDAWYHAAVDFALENKIMGGYNATTFGPNDTLSRAMVVQILYNKEGQPAVSGAHSFTDAPADQWYNNAIIWGTTKGVMGGYGDGKFGPDDSVTIEQIAVILWNYSGNPAFTGTADSVGAHSGWAANGLAWAVENGLLEGVPYEVVTAPATRAQTAQIFMNYLSK